MVEIDRDPGSIPVPVRNWPKTGIPVPVPVDGNYRDFNRDFQFFTTEFENCQTWFPSLNLFSYQNDE